MLPLCCPKRRHSRIRKLSRKGLNSILWIATWSCCKRPWTFTLGCSQLGPGSLASLRQRRPRSKIWRRAIRTSWSGGSLPEKWRSLVVTAPFLSHLQPHPRDVILFSKQYMASSQLSQKPLLYMPWELVSQLSPKPMPEPSLRHCFSECQAKKILKTASLMETWKYKDSAAFYLQNLAPWL